MPTRAQIRAQALIELIRRGATNQARQHNACTVTEMNPVIDTDRTGEIDPILAALDQTHPTHRTHPYGSGDTAGGCCSDRPGPGALIGVPVTDTAGNRLWFTPTQWELLVCNSQISETLLDHLGMPVAVRERLRLPNRAMRRALVVRDGGCVFPGCDAPPGWCDAHHVIEYADDGQTVIVNLVLLCRHHHGIVHRTGWTMNFNHTNRNHPDQPGDHSHFTITTATGLELPTQHRPRPPRPPPTPRTTGATTRTRLSAGPQWADQPQPRPGLDEHPHGKRRVHPRIRQKSWTSARSGSSQAMWCGCSLPVAAAGVRRRAGRDAGYSLSGFATCRPRLCRRAQLAVGAREHRRLNRDRSGQVDRVVATERLGLRDPPRPR
ncbi:MAG: HNH endonuclease [Microthrixaceae bacterium]|nr:HNH endonuclease [Microthrixaceae bacterium]